MKKIICTNAEAIPLFIDTVKKYIQNFDEEKNSTMSARKAYSLFNIVYLYNLWND